MLRIWIWLAQRPGITPRQRKALLDYFGDVQSLYRCDAAQVSTLGLSKKCAHSLLDKDLSQAEQTLSLCQQKGIGVFHYGDHRYPQRLRELADAPMVLYYLGNLPDLNQLAAIAVVGTRKCTDHGLAVTRQLTSQLCQGGAAIVSGMAYGVDAAATSEALNAGAITLGVLGCGIDQIYPASNRSLFYRMRARGCLLSEYPPGTKAQKWFFPERNRIISGLSLGTLVTEAPETSGALITARAALDQNRDVFAVPGPEDAPAWAGCKRLIEQGATAATTGWDILSAYAYQLPGRFHRPPEAQPHPWDLPAEAPAQKITIDKASAPNYHVVDNRPALSPQAQAVLDALEQGENEVDQVIARAGIDPSGALAVLTMLEMRGLICRPSPRHIARK